MRDNETTTGAPAAAGDLGPAGGGDAAPASGALPHLAADALPVLISYVDAGQRYRFVNRTYEEWFGRPRAEVVGRTVVEVLGEAAYERVRGHVEAALSGRRLAFEGLVPYRDGGARHIEARYEPHCAPDGRVLGYYALVTDVSARVRAEAALREAERRQAFLLALGDRLRGLADPAGVTAAAAEALGRYLGVARAGYGEIDAAGEVVSVERDWTDGGATASLAGEARLLDGFGRAIVDELRAGRTLLVEDCLTDPRSAGDGPAAAWAGIGTRALIVVPLVRGGRLTAILYLHEPAPRRWADAEAALAEDVAERTWSAAERARAEDDLRRARARAEELAAERAAVLGQLAEGVIVTDPAGRITFVNEAAARLHGVARLDVPPEAYSETYHLYTEDGRPYPPAELPLARAVLGGETVADARWRVRRPDGTEVLAIGSARPLRAADGSALGAVLTVRDDTAREAAERALREGEARFRAIVEDQTEFISRLAPDLTVTFVNRAYAAQLGRPREGLLGTSMLDLMTAEQRARFTAGLAGLTPEAPVVSYEMDTVLADGTPGWEHWTDRALFDAAGRLVGYQSVGRDITGAKRAEAQRELLLAELSHRVKNTLAVVQGIASRSFAAGRPPEEARDAFTSRLLALANAHSLLTASEWRGASLRTLVEGELRPYGGRAVVAAADGERDIALGPRAALTLSLVLHELATNAAKHGALSSAEGRVEVAWRRDGPALRLTWSEAGGPAVAGPGGRRGFGRTMMERAVAHELAGEARLEFRPGGIAYELRAPLARLTAPA